MFPKKQTKKQSVAKLKAKLCIICWKEHQNTMQKTCSPWCERKHRANLNKINKEKVRIKNEKVKENKINSVSYLDKKIEIDWRKAVRLNYCWICAYCGKDNSQVQLHCHHLFTRSRKATRWDIDNGILLCASHHTLSSEFSAHMTGNEFFLWLEEIKGRKWIDELMKKSNKIVSYTPEFIKERHKEIKEFLEKNK